jgi:hypothetical protein
MTDQPDDGAPVEPADDAADERLVERAEEPEVEEPEVDESADDQFDGGIEVDEHRARGTGHATGHAAVDEVLRSLDGLDGKPVDEHVAAFEQAHEVLRRALSDAGDDTVSREG